MTYQAVKSFIQMKAPDLQIVSVSGQNGRIWGRFRLTKTLLINAGHRHVVVVVEEGAKLSRRSSRAEFGRPPRLITPSLVETLTGHSIEAVSPFALASRILVYFDTRLLSAPLIAVSAGLPGLVVVGEPRRLCNLVGGTWADLVTAPAEPPLNRVGDLVPA
jgi:prolyl-tRNA editing enzyme YbaK/EbsC (Cys-tRNA(Pro) deacylase)